MVSADGLTKDGQFNANHIAANLDETMANVTGVCKTPQFN
jgi:hypothetical protein